LREEESLEPRGRSMEFVMGQIRRELREEEEWWIVWYQAVELMAFETLWRAHEWRRTTPLYAHYEVGAGVRYYMKEAATWYVRTADSRGWHQAEDQSWVERQVKESEERYRNNTQALGWQG
jgi:hypothetical protein